MFESLKKEMNDQGIKPYTLAKLAKIAPPDMYHALNGDKQMFPNWKKRIAAVLGKPVETLFPESEARPNDR